MILTLYITIVLAPTKPFRSSCDLLSLTACDGKFLSVKKYVNKALVLLVHHSPGLKYESIPTYLVIPVDEIFDGKLSHSYSFSS